MSDKLDLTVDEAVDAIARIYWEDIARGIVDKDIDKVYNAAINLKATESTRASMKEKFEQ
jgi:phenylalanine-4-hydroxylase